MNKKRKKWLSLTLAATMALSTCAVGFTAFAADKTPAEVEAMIMDTAFSTSSSNKPENTTVDDLYKQFTDAEKQQISKEATVKVFYWAYNASAGKYSDKQKAAGELLGGYPSEVQQAIDVNMTISGYGTLDIEIDGATQTIAVPSSYYSNFNYTADVKIGDVTYTAAQQKAIVEKMIALYNGCSARTKYIMENTPVNNASSAPKGPYAYLYYTTNTNSYGIRYLIQAYTAYAGVVIKGAGEVEATPAQIQDYVVKNFPFANAEPFNYRAGLDSLLKAVKACNDFLALTNPSAKQKQDALKAIADYQALYSTPGSVEPWVAALSYGKFVVYNGALVTPSSARSSVNGLKGTIEDIQILDEFVKSVNDTYKAKPAVITDEYNVKIRELKAAYTALSSNNKKLLQNDHAAEFGYLNELLVFATLDEIAANDHNTDFVAETVTAQIGAPLQEILMNTIIPSIASVMKMGPGATLKEMIDSQFTDANVTALMKMIYPALYGVMNAMPDVDTGILGVKPVVSLFNLTPSKIASQFNSDYPKVAAELKKLTDSPDDWAKVGNLEWGVTAGNYDEFITAVLSTFKGVTSGLGGGIFTSLLQNLLVGTWSKTPDGNSVDMTTFAPGGWDYLIIPLMEALGVEDCPTAAEYVFTVGTGTKTFLATLKPLTDVIYNQLLPKILEDPVDYLLTNLPNFAYHLEDGCLVDGINKALDNMKGSTFGTTVDLKPTVMAMFADAEGNVPEKLTLEMVFNMVSGALSGLGINLTLDDVLKVGKMGTATTTTTKRAGVESRTKIIADKTSVASYVLNAAYTLLPGLLGVNLAPKGDFVKVEAPQYPHNGKMDKKVMNAMVGGLDSLLGGILNLKETVNGLFTNELAANAITGIYDALAPILGAVGIVVTPQQVADMMKEDRYAELRIDLGVASWADVGLVIKNDDGIVYQSNMGFKNGDRDGFVSCLAAALRPLVKALLEADLIVNTEGGYGLYETLIIPTFEAIGLTPTVDSATYTENYRKLAMKSDPGAAYDYLVKTILSPVLGLIDNFTAAPAATLMKLLPNVAYAVQYNSQLAFVGDLLSKKGGLNGLLNGLLQGLATGKDANGNAIYGLAKLVLPEIPLDALASCGKLVEKSNSKSALHETYTIVEADSADAFVTVYYYLYDAINTGENLAVLKDTVSGIEMDKALKGVADNLLNDIFTASKEESLCKLAGLLAADIWECPDAAGNSGNKTPGTGDVAVPVIVILTVMVSAGAAIVLLRRKKQQTEI